MDSLGTGRVTRHQQKMLTEWPVQDNITRKWVGIPGHLFSRLAQEELMPADLGSIAPDFTLPDENREPVTLSRYRGRPVVLAFFPAAFSSVCTKELCTFRDALSRLNNVNAQVFGISVDSFFALKAFHDQQGLTFPLLSDFNKQVIRAFGVFNEDMIGLKGLAKRAVFVLDNDGVIRYREVLEDARNEPDYQEVYGAVAALR